MANDDRIAVLGQSVDLSIPPCIEADRLLHADSKSHITSARQKALASQQPSGAIRYPRAESTPYTQADIDGVWAERVR
jgi:hypothetical protein